MDEKGVAQGEESSCSYLEMLKCGMGEETEEEILGFSSGFLGFGGLYEPVGLPLMYHGVSGTGNSTSTTAQQMSSESSSMSSLSSSPTSTAATNSMLTTTSSSRQQKKKQENGGRKTEATSGGNNKKPKTGGVSQSGTIKVRKEKLGERIMALQQLVSPFGKSDTASVLHEALGYIRFLHEQVQLLSSPYLQNLPSCTTLHEGARTADLRSRGLCLVPVSCTEHVTSANGADLWSPSVGNCSHPSFSSNH